ncbi:YfcC family protein [Microbacterium sp. BWT-B31]|uniref:YfcC family protein n=1 Tax=Microbacterium sp. BWT-B31 TaxID=3232072 RepID=UPI003529A97B
MSAATTVAPDTGSKPRKPFSFPSALTILGLVLLLVWIAAFFIPSGTYERDESGSPIVGTYTQIEAQQSFFERLVDLLIAPVNGLYGLQNAETGFIAPFGQGFLFGAAGVFLFILAIGSFMTAVFATGAMDRGIARLAHSMRERGWLMISAIIVLFSLLGSTMGWADETLGFYALIIPLALALGYDRLVVLGAVFVSSAVGAMASTVNPFSIGVASGEADVSIGEGIGLRLVLWFVLTGITVAYVLWYARRVKKNPATSILPETSPAEAAEEVDKLTRRQVWVLVVTAIVFLLMIFAVIPWASVLPGEWDAPFAWELGWWFPELIALFIVGTIVVGLVGGLGEKGIATAFTKGSGDFIGPALVVMLARGVTVILNNSQTIDTILHAMEQAVADASNLGFTALVWVINAGLAIIVPSSSGHAALAMPLLAPLSDFADVTRPLMITTWNTGARWMGIVTPTNGVLMGGLAIAAVRYDKYVRFIWPLMVALAVATLTILLIATAAQG